MANTLTEGPRLDPHQGAVGFLATVPDPYRYDGNHDLDPHEVSGMIASLVPIGAKVLDVVCGTGALAVVMCDQRNAQVFGIEPDASRAARAVERGIRMHAGVLSPSLLPFMGQFDVAVYADVLEHLVDLLRVLQEVAPFVKSDELVIVSVPNVAHYNLYLIRVENFTHDLVPADIGFDAAMPFAPDWRANPPTRRPSAILRIFRRLGLHDPMLERQNVMSYADNADGFLVRPGTNYLQYPCVTPMWDNSARRKVGAAIFHNSTPALY